MRRFTTKRFNAKRFITKKTLGLYLVASCAFLSSAASPVARAQVAAKFDSVKVDALDADAWNGVVFAARAFRQPSDFGLRFGSFNQAFIDGPAIFDVVREVGPHAPDASYCRMSWVVPPRNARITLEWSRIEDTTVVGTITADSNFQIVLETYIPFAAGSWGLPGVYKVEENKQAIAGERFFDGVFGLSSKFVVMIDQPTIGSGTYPSLDQLRDTMKNAGVLVESIDSDPSRNAAGLQFATGKSRTAHFVATLGWNKKDLLSHAQAWLAPGKIDAMLKQKSDAYAARRPSVDGLFAGATDAIGNNMFWNTLYAPQPDLVFPSITRKWAHGAGWVLGEWDGFLGSLLSGLEDKDQSLATIRALLLSQTESGFIPNVVTGGGDSPDRSQPPVGAYCVWKLLQRYPDEEMLKWAYPRLKKWHEWWFNDRGDGQPWRDGNRNGLLEWGSDRGSSGSSGGRGFLMHARWESGMDDNPMWDDVHYDPHTYTMELDDVGLNSLYALDAESLAALAAQLGKEDDRQAFLADYDKMKRQVREKLWNDADGIYENRFWNGEFSKRLSPSNFYPMLAGIATPQQAERMVHEHLLNPREFWGEYVAPTTPRNDPAFADQYYWRGSIWGPTNYLLYHAIDRYGFDQTALEFAQKSYALFMDDWKNNQHDNELYHAWGGSGGGDIHYTWGALLCLLGVEQFMDANPWDGLRFGAFNPGAEGHLYRATWQNHSYDVTVGPSQTEVARDGKIHLRADAGIVVRSYEESSSRVSMKLKSERDFHLTISELGVGPVKVALDGKTAGQIKVSQGAATFAVARGEHQLELTH
jgi:hypothetical protein